MSEQLSLPVPSARDKDRDRLEREFGRFELGSRRDSCTAVVVSWVKKSNLCIVTLTDIAKNQTVEFAIEPEDVVEALAHPYPAAYAAGVEFDG